MAAMRLEVPEIETGSKTQARVALTFRYCPFGLVKLTASRAILRSGNDPTIQFGA
jgi:hypothetical protein